MGDRKDPEYEVGYGRPPVTSRFKPGQSGNPKGRRKGSQNLATLVDRELKQPVMVNEGGKRRHITKGEVIVKQVVNKSAAGDPRSMQMLLGLMLKLVGPAEAGAGQTHPLSEDDRQTLDNALARMRRLENGGDDGES
ncbi:MAG: hypothetical protein KGJ41_14250 [Rhodospirillales bacterium]|nr:hypothetical protein [Rhodospirillales bacterium]